MEVGHAGDPRRGEVLIGVSRIIWPAPCSDRCLVANRDRAASSARQPVCACARSFPRGLATYIEQTVDTPSLDNSERLGKLIRGGELRLSLSDALALTLENNLDIVVQRYVVYFSQTDILRTKSGQAARGFSGAFMPGELNSGAIGAGVTSSGGTGGTGNAGGITGGGGAVNIGPAGAFEPAVSFGFRVDRVTSPLNSVVVSGIPTTTSEATSLSATYAQMFTNGASYSVSLSGLRQSTTQRNTLFNPDVTTRLSIGFNQPLLAGSGKLPNERFMLVARNNQKSAREVFRLQVINSVVQLENAYWDLAAAQENVRVAAESVTAAKELLQDSRKQYEIGTMSGIDVVTAESQEAAAERDLIVARTALEQQTTTLKQLISKRSDPALDAAAIVITDPQPEPLPAICPRSMRRSLRPPPTGRSWRKPASACRTRTSPSSLRATTCSPAPRSSASTPAPGCKGIPRS